MERLRRSVARFVQAEPQEIWPLAWSFGYFFCLLCGYYILRPVRDEMAIQGGVHNLPWMMTGTFLTLLAVTPLFGWLSARFSRYRVLLAVYLFFISNLVCLYLLMTGRQYIEWVARGFFVWLSVFNLFVVSVFWSFMADLFTPAQGARLFGMIAAGGSTGPMGCHGPIWQYADKPTIIVTSVRNSFFIGVWFLRRPELGGDTNLWIACSKPLRQSRNFSGEPGYFRPNPNGHGRYVLDR